MSEQAHHHDDVEHARRHDDNDRKITQLSGDVNFSLKSLGRIEQTQKQHSVRFAGVESRLDALAVGQRDLRESQREIQQSQQQLVASHGRLSEDMMDVKSRLGGVEIHLVGVDTRLEGLDTRLDGVDTRLDGLDTKLVRVLVLLGDPADQGDRRDG